MTRMAKTEISPAKREAQAAENLRRGVASDSFIASQNYGAPARRPSKAQASVRPNAAVMARKTTKRRAA